MNIETILVTPELAQEWLATNTDNNRRKKPATIRRYANDMLRGEWLENTGQTIKFDTAGRLIDGQHRLEGVVMSRKSIRFEVVRGVSPDAIHVIDTGATRSAGDALTISGHNGYSNLIAALARKIMAIEGGNGMVLGEKKIKLGASAITNRDIVEFCRNKDLVEHVRFGHKVHQQQFVKTLSVGEYIFLHWFLGRVDIKAAETFLSSLASLKGLPEDSPIYVLARRLNSGKDTLGPKEKIHAIAQSWNAWRTGKKISLIRVANLESEPSIPQLV